MQHAKMRKILSFILSLALIVGLVPSIALPAAEAADGDVVTYDFKYYGDKTSGTESFFTTKGVSGLKYTNNQSGCGYWEYLNHNIYSTNTDLSNLAPRDSTFMRNTKNANPNVYFQGGYDSSGYGAWVAFKVKGLSNGLYDVSMNTYHYANRTTKVGLYLLPGSVIDAANQGNTLNNIHGVVKYNTSDTELHAEAIARFPEAKLIGSKKSLDGSAAWKEINLGKVSVTGGTEETEYVLVIKIEEPTPVASASSQPLDYLCFPEITFTRQPLGTLTVADTNVNAGDKINLDISLVDAENAPITDAEISVECDDNTVVITDNGDIYAVAPGSAEIAVTAEKDGKLEETTATVTISGGESVFASGDASYVFKQGIYEIDETNSWVYNIDNNKANEIYSSYGTVGRNWRFVDTTCTWKDSKGNSININDAYMATGTNENEWSAWCVQVPKAGKYVVDMSGLFYNGGGMAEVYMAPYTEGMDVKAAITSENLVGTMDEYFDTLGVQTKTIGLFDAETHGEYLMVIRGVKNAAGKTYLHIANVTLKGADYYIAPESEDIFGAKAVYVEKADNGSYTAHFAAGINSLDYKEVGFKVSVASGAEEILPTTAAYDKVVVAGGGANGDVKATELGLNSGYVFCKDKSGIAAGSKITFTPYAIELDGTEIIGKTYSVTVTAAE